jgi:hypothetical protein
MRTTHQSPPAFNPSPTGTPELAHTNVVYRATNTSQVKCSAKSKQQFGNKKIFGIGLTADKHDV